MAYWGWRPLMFCLFISVLVSACETSPAPSPISTSLPPVTLTLRISGTPPPSASLTALVQTPVPRVTATPVHYIVQPGDTGSRIGLALGINPTQLVAANPFLENAFPRIGEQLALPIQAATLSPLDLILHPPRCTITFTDTLVCLGSLQNTTPMSVQRVGVQGKLYSKDGRLLQSQVSAIEQRIISSGQTAPYRLLFTSDNNARSALEDADRLVVVLRSAEPASLEKDLLSLEVINTAGDLDDTVYRFEGILSNQHHIDIYNVRVVVSVMDDLGQVAGYRVIDLERVSALQQIRLQTEIVLLLDADDHAIWTHTVHVEAWQS
jgi:LysM repeat protein